MDILELYNKSQTQPLEAHEVAWLESQVNKYPYFPLPYSILAKDQMLKSNGNSTENLLKASTYALDRSLLKSYILGDEEPVIFEVQEEATFTEETETASEEKESQEVEAIEETSHSEVEEKAESEVENEPDQKSEVPEADVPVEAEVEEAGTGKEIVAVSEEEETEQPEGADEEDAAEEEVLTESPEASDADDESGDAESSDSVPTEEIPDEEESRDEEESEDSSEAITEVTPVEPLVIPDPNPVGKINWYLNTRVSLRIEKYQRLNQKLGEELAAFAGNTENGKSASSSEKTTQKEVAPKSEKESVSPAPEEKTEKASHTDNKNTASTEAASNKPEEPETKTPEVESPAFEPVVNVGDSSEKEEAEAKDQQEKAKIAASSASENANKNAEITAEEKVDPESSDEEYTIGAFSSFTFLDEAVPVEEEEVDAQIAEAEAVELKQEVESGNSQIIFEENDRVVEISITAEELRKYFSGKSPGTVKAPETEKEEPEAKESLRSSEEEEAKSDEIIEKFIQTDPTLSDPRTYKATKGNLAANSTIDPEDLVTETLAKIHADQGNISKAIKIYKKLSLLFPGKSDYFADQIKKLKK